MDRQTLLPSNTLRLPVADTPHEQPDIAVAALPLLNQLRDELQAAVSRSSRWGVPRLFFFDRKLQAEWKALRPDKNPLPPALLARIDDARTILTLNRHARQAARAVSGLRAAAEAIAPMAPAVRELADLLALADDEVIRVVCPAMRTGYRLYVRGMADIWQFHVLLASAITGDPGRGYLVGSRPHPRIVAACSDPQATIDGDTFSARFQFYHPSALRPGGTLPAGFSGSDYWVWGSEWVTDLTPVAGERVVVLGEPAFTATWDVTRRVPRVAAEVSVLEVMSVAAVADWIGDRTGRRPTWAEPGVPMRRAA